MIIIRIKMYRLFLGFFVLFLLCSLFVSVGSAAVINSLTLRPNSDSYADFTPMGDTANYKCVDDVVADDATTYCRSIGADRRDKLGLPDHTTEYGAIINITIFTRGRSASSTDYISIWGDGFGESAVTSYGASWSNRSHAWTTDPGGGAWTWEDVDDLAIGYRSTNTNYGDITQCYAVVYYYEGVSVFTNATAGVEEGNATLNGFLYNGGDTCTVRFEYGTTTAYGTNTTNQTLNSNTTFNAGISGLSAGTLYHYRAYANNSVGNYSLGSDMTFYTKPDGPKSVYKYSNVDDTFSFAWTKGTGAGNTVIVRNATGYFGFPATPTNGTVVYNSTGSSYYDSIEPGYRYLYTLWSWKGDKFSDNKSNVYNWTYPQNPYSMDASLYVNNINVTWSAGRGAATTVLVRKSGSSPSSPTDGTVLQNSSLTYYNDTVVVNSFYAAFSYNDTLNVYSSGTSFEWGGLYINCYNENTSAALTFSVFITNADGTDVYEDTGCTNTHLIDVGDCPNGEDILIIINATGYNSRLYYMDLFTGYFYTLNAYLGEVTNLYVFQVIDEYNEPLSNVKINIKRYINESYGFQNVSTIYTGANGEAYCYLVPSTYYKIILSKDLYITSYEDYETDPDYYGVYYPTIFRLNFALEDEDVQSLFYEYITFTATMSSNGSILISYLDSESATVNTTVYVYMSYNDTKTLVYGDNRTGDSDFSFYVTGINTSRMYVVYLWFNHTIDFSISQPVIRYVFPVNYSSFTDAVSFEARLTAVFGNNPLGWGNSIAIAIGIFFLASFGPFDAATGIICCAGGILVTEVAFAFSNAVLLGLIPVIIVLGIVYFMTKRPEEHL